MELPRTLQADVDDLNGLLTTQSADLARLQAAAHIVARTVPGCDSASIGLLVEDAALTGACTSRLALEADLVQYREQEGPCLSAAGRRSAVRIDVLAEDERFVHFAPGAIALGVESVLSLPLVADELGVGSLNLYSTTPRAFVDVRPDLVAPIADYTADVIATSALYAASVDVLERLIDIAEEATLVEMALEALRAERGLGSGEAWAALHHDAMEVGSMAAAARRVVTRQRQERAEP